MFEKTCKFHPANHIFGTRDDDDFRWMTYYEFYDIVNRTRNILAHLGVKKGDRVASISNNRWEWAAVTYATMSLGAQVVPMYEQQLEEDWTYIINDAKTKIIFASTEKIYKTVKPLAGAGVVEHVLCFDAAVDKTHSYHQ